MNDQAIPRDSICLAPGVELLAGPDETPLLYISERKSYVRLSASGAEIVRLLTSQRAVAPAEVRQMLASKYEMGEAELARRIAAFLQQLDEAGALAHEEGATAQPQLKSWLARAARRVAAKPRLNLFSCQIDRTLAAGPVALLKARTGNVIGTIVGLAALLAMAAVVVAAARGGAMVRPARISLPFIIGGLLIHAIFHELSHALTGSYYGVKTREIGVALLYYFLPVAYTDRTDAYRLRNFNSRAAIALAGPTFDLYGAGFSAVMSCLMGGVTAVNFRSLMWLQVVALLSSLNPLLPGDGYHILEAWFGAFNFRRRAFSLLFRRLTFRELPPHLLGLGNDQQLGHIAYAMAALGYTLLLAGTFIYNLSHIPALVFGR